MDLNTIVQEYTVWNDGPAEEELKTLKEHLGTVPVNMRRLQSAIEKRGGSYGNLLIEAELITPVFAIGVFNNLDENEADRITGRLQIPYARIAFDFSALGKNAKRMMRHGFASCFDAEDNAILVHNGSRDAGVVYERNGKYRLVEFLAR
jgi:hypothetical protein